MRWDVEVRGAGWAGRAVASALRRRGVRAVVVGDAAPPASHASLGVVLPCHPEHPNRFLSSMGEEKGRAYLDFLAWGRALLAEAAGDGWLPTGVDWRGAGPELGERADSLAAAAALGIAVEETEGGYRLLDGGCVDLDALDAAWACEVWDEAGEGPVEAEITVLATGWQPADVWLLDKLFPVRLQQQRFEGLWVEPPVISQHFTVWWAGDRVAGARWGTPHLEVGETALEASPKVRALQEGLTRRWWEAATPAGEERVGIVAESCDGLPLVGMIPGRPTTLVCNGFGFLGLPAIAAAAESLAEALTEGQPSRLPDFLSPRRFL